MRKYVILAMVAVASMVMSSLAFAGEPQTITANLSPTKLDKNKFKPATIFVDIQTVPDKDANPNLDQPPSAVRTVVDFPKNAKFDPSAVPTCTGTEAQLQNTTTDQAKEICGSKSIVSVASGTSAHVTVDTNPSLPNSSTIPVPVVVTAFNGHEPNTLFLHSRADSVNNTTVLVGKLKSGPTGFGSSLDVTIPPLLAGAIDDFKTTVKNGKYVQARCKSKTNKFRATSTYSNHPQTVAETTSKCKQKPSKHKH
jgi:hypothetical protein